MSMANFVCPICRERLVLLDGDQITALICGHVFHEKCVRTWLQGVPERAEQEDRFVRNRSCPSCRHPSTPTSGLKLFFETEDNYTIDESIPGVSELRLKYEVAAHEVKSLKERSEDLAAETSKFRNVNIALRKEIQRYKTERDKFRVGIVMQTDELKKAHEQRRNQNSMLQALARERDSLQTELTQSKKENAKLISYLFLMKYCYFGVKKRLNSYKRLHLNRSTNISQLLNSNSVDADLNAIDANSLRTVLSACKRDLQNATRTEQQLKSELQSMHSTIKRLQNKNNALTEELSIKDKIIGSIKKSMREQSGIRGDVPMQETEVYIVDGPDDSDGSEEATRPKRRQIYVQDQSGFHQVQSVRSSDDFSIQVPFVGRSGVKIQMPSNSNDISIVPSTSREEPSTSQGTNARDVPFMTSSLKRQREVNNRNTSESRHYDGLGGSSNSRRPLLRSGHFVTSQQPLLKKRK